MQLIRRSLSLVVVVPDGAPGGWWTDEVRSLDGKVDFQQAGLKIYMARWFVQNSFSYSATGQIRTCD